MPNRDLAALVGSRICHDLTSPLGAIGNGVELLGLTGATAGPEMALISESVENATARLRFFRIAFGARDAAHPMRRSEVTGLLAAGARGGRIRHDWDVAEDLPRGEVALAFLAFLCLETAMPAGGAVRATHGSGWRIVAEAERLRAEGPLWEALTDSGPAPEVTPAQVQFALLSAALAEQSRRLKVEQSPGRVVLTF